MDDPESEQGLAEDPLESSTRHKRGAEGAVQAGEWIISTIKIHIYTDKTSGLLRYELQHNMEEQTQTQTPNS